MTSFWQCIISFCPNARPLLYNYYLSVDLCLKKLKQKYRVNSVVAQVYETYH